MTTRLLSGAFGAAASLLLSASALAHASLEIGEAAPGSSYKGVVRIPHGCAGAPTTAIRVRIPEGVVAVKPMPKPGWGLATAKGAYAGPHDYFGKSLSEGVTEIAWSGGKLADEHYDEFVFRAHISSAVEPGPLRFPVIQDCEAVSVRWDETAGEGPPPKHPAPSVRIAQAKPTAPSAATYRAGPLVIEAPWSRATPGGARVAGGFMRITNTGTEPDRLIGGTSAAASGFEVHETTTNEGVARMRPVEGGLVIRPGQSVELKPGGYHVMFTSLSRALKEGDSLAGTLVFEKAGSVAVEYRVGPVGARASAGEHKHH